MLPDMIRLLLLLILPLLSCRPLPVAAVPPILTVINHTEYRGQEYEILPDPLMHRVVVMTGPLSEPEPTLILKVSNAGGRWQRVKLEISRLSSESVVYAGYLPEKIEIHSDSRILIESGKKARR
jgi:hypothetical protein